MSGAALDLYDPSTGLVFGCVESDTADSLAAKVAAARAAQPAWAARPYVERQATIRRFRDLLVERKDALAKIQTRETGKPITQARGELSATPERIGFFLANTEGHLLSTPMATGATVEEIRYAPLGVVTNISAWNYPWFVGTNVYVPALLAGNAVLYKPSECATLTGRAMAELLCEAGVPEDVFTPIIGGGEVGAGLLSHATDGVFFTGSHATGLRVAEAAARHLCPVQLELGGKDPAYVADDVDPAVAAAGLADGAFYNNGQSCCAVERLYVHTAVHDAFVEAFVAAVSGFVMGAPTDEATYLGPLTREPHLAVLQAQVDDAVAKGATIRSGGHRATRPGWYYEPTVLTGVTHEMDVMREETFGPVIGIQRVADDDEAAALMDDTRYGLTAAVYTASRDRAEAILARTDSGTAYWNCCDRVSPRLPWTGRRNSGVGATLSHAGIRAFVRPRAFHLRAPV